MPLPIRCSNFLNDTILKLEKNFGIDAQKFGIACLVAFGYRKKEPGRKTRQSLDEILAWYN